MKKRILCFICLGLSLVACKERRVETDRVRTVVSILPQAEFVKRVGGSKAAVTVMIPPGSSPPTYEPTPSQLVEVSRASMYVRVGAHFVFEQAWMDKIIGINPGMKIVDCSEGIEMLGADPHIWLSPKNARGMVENIFRGITQVDADNWRYYEQNLKQYLQELEALDREIAQTLSGLENRRFMVYHPAWTYFARDYRLEQVAIEKEGKHATPKGVAELIELARKEGVTTLFASPQFRTDQAALVAREIGGKVVLISPLEENYSENLRKVANALAEK